MDYSITHPYFDCYPSRPTSMVIYIGYYSFKYTTNVSILSMIEKLNTN